MVDREEKYRQKEKKETIILSTILIEFSRKHCKYEDMDHWLLTQASSARGEATEPITQQQLFTVFICLLTLAHPLSRRLSTLLCFRCTSS